MARAPKARSIVLDAAERLVKEQGAASLTFEKLSEASGVTRGGITYHFPTKESLLRALVERGLRHWQNASEALVPDDAPCPVLGETIGHLRYVSQEDQEPRRLFGGLIAAATHDPSLLDPVRAYHAERLAERTWTDRELKLFMLELVGSGLFWQQLFDLQRLPPHARKRLLEIVEELAVAWADEAQGKKA